MLNRIFRRNNLCSEAVLSLRQVVAGLSPQGPEFAPSSVRIGFVVYKVALEQVFLRVSRFSPVNIVPLWLPILIYLLGDEQ
jgi:hypothetical protein